MNNFKIAIGSVIMLILVLKCFEKGVNNAHIERNFRLLQQTNRQRAAELKQIKLEMAEMFDELQKERTCVPSDLMPFQLKEMEQ